MVQSMKRIVPLGFVCVLCGHMASMAAADLRSVMPVTDTILVLHFADGRIDYSPSFAERVTRNKLYFELLDTTAASQAGRYLLSSPDDASYAVPKTPVYTARKSKGAEFHSKFANDGLPKFLSEHWIYLELPEAMKDGCLYQLSLDGLADNGNSFEFRFDSSTRSPTIHVSQAGFKPDSPKYAYLSQWMGDFNKSPHLEGGLELDAYSNTAFQVIDDVTGESVFSGTVRKRLDKTQMETTTTKFGPSRNFNKTDVWEADFSAFNTPGRYRLVVDRMGCSYPFNIEADPFQDAFHAAMRGLFLMRSGIVQEVEPGVEYPRGHNSADPWVTYYYDPNYKFWLNSNHSLTGFNFNSRPVTGPVYGGYHDAGDWDSYLATTHQAIPLSLLVLYDLNPDKYTDGQIGNRYKVDPDGPWVEEGSNGVPDLIDEARWLIDFMRRIRDALVADGYGTGGVSGYARRDAGAGMASWLDDRPMALTAEDPLSTYKMAANIALLSDILQGLHERQGNPGESPEAASLRGEAVDAYAWATNYLAAHAAEKTSDIDGARMTAAAALYRLTGDPAYQASFIDLYTNAYGTKNNAIWTGMPFQVLGEAIYVSIDSDTPGLDIEKQTTIRNAFVSRANSGEASVANLRAFRLGFDAGRSSNLGMFTTPTSMYSLFAHAYSMDKTYSDVLLNRAAYSLGGNNLNLSHMTGIGQERERAPFIPDEWMSMDITSMAYRYANFPGISVYFKAGDNAFFVSGDGDERWSDSTGYPAVVTPSSGNWAYAELRFFNRNSIAGSEFTIHQNNLINAMVYGYLAEKPSPTWTPNKPPSVSINLSDGETLSRNGPLALTATASADTERVEYYYNWHFIGESRDKTNNFRLVWDPTMCALPSANSVTLSAIAYDADGEVSRHTTETDAVVEMPDSPWVGSLWIWFNPVKGWIDTGERGEPGFGWIFDDAWPYVYGYAFAEGFAGPGAGWIYVSPTGASLQGFNAYAYGANIWMWLSPSYGGWYYNYTDPQSGTLGWSLLMD